MTLNSGFFVIIRWKVQLQNYLCQYQSSDNLFWLTSPMHGNQTPGGHSHIKRMGVLVQNLRGEKKKVLVPLRVFSLKWRTAGVFAVLFGIEPTKICTVCRIATWYFLGFFLKFLMSTPHHFFQGSLPHPLSSSGTERSKSKQDNWKCVRWNIFQTFWRANSVIKPSTKQTLTLEISSQRH